MGTASDARGLDRGRTTEAEVMELEVDPGGVAGLREIPEDDPLHLAALRRYRARVPDLAEQRFKVVGQPRKLEVGVHHRHHHVVSWHRRPLRNSPDLDRQTPAVDVDDPLPAGLVEQACVAEVERELLAHLLDVLGRYDWAREIALCDVLEAEEDDLRELAASALVEGVDPLRLRRVLPEVRHLV